MQNCRSENWEQRGKGNTSYILAGLNFMSLIFLQGLFFSSMISFLVQAVSLKMVQDGCHLEKWGAINCNGSSAAAAWPLKFLLVSSFSGAAGLAWLSSGSGAAGRAGWIRDPVSGPGGQGDKGTAPPGLPRAGPAPLHTSGSRRSPARH